MPFARQVSIGRVALVQYPEAEAGKLVVISDVVSANAVSLGQLHSVSLAGTAAGTQPSSTYSPQADGKQQGDPLTELWHVSGGSDSLGWLLVAAE
jgi:hypothetical protein